MICEMDIFQTTVATKIICHELLISAAPISSLKYSSISLNCNQKTHRYNLVEFRFIDGIRSKNSRRKRREYCAIPILASSSSNAADATASVWDNWVPEKGSKVTSLSDILWPSAGAFVAMAVLGKIDQLLEPRGIAMTIAPFGAVCAVLFTTPSAPGARKYNMFMAQIACALIGVLAFSIFGPGWLARSSALAAAIAFMIYSGAIHPPAASLPLLFIDAAKFHHLNFWYALFPGATGCIVLCLVQELVCYLKENCRF